MRENRENNYFSTRTKLEELRQVIFRLPTIDFHYSVIRHPLLDVYIQVFKKGPDRFLESGML